MVHSLTEEQKKSLESLRDFYYADKVDIGYYVSDRILRLLQHNKFIKLDKQSFKKVFENKYFFYKDGKTTIAFFIKLNNDKFDFVSTKIIEHSTSFGKLYIASNKKFTYCFTAHFFDRMQERLHINKRDMALRQLLIFILNNFIVPEENNDVIIMKVHDGIAKGIVYKNVCLLKTFISEITASKKELSQLKKVNNNLQIIYNNNLHFD